MCADRAGTKQPIWASTAISAFCRRKVDLPAMLGPVTSQSLPADSPPTSQPFGDKGTALLAQHLFDHRVPPPVDLEGQAVVDARPNVAFGGGQFGKRRGDVECGEHVGRPLDGTARLDRCPRQLGEDGEFDGERSLRCGGDASLEFGELGGREAHGAGQRLTVDGRAG